LFELTHWTECKKKTTTNLDVDKTKANNYYLDIRFRKWFPLSKVPSSRTTTLEELVSPTNQKHQVAQQ
jgi:hypothetical protein